ncbi:MAG: hypothetical protein A2W98_07480 [Bacteroidetes bacterium GWF2_33_38]|nr:MAG: hypothetical protein A2W98_07480 [Bacteroidetes bacterium GWF2_33_38]OFY69064.1 MAG: hypothetical protein A2265_05985 [Bacteroidetes bacterium RIFOXYA12_FULL_33_9]OFY89788.1 MAG: hypothetical protein A2236_05345 [Bacteroidetes bacterium RIFOXYA2_FULL_33_7]
MENYHYKINKALFVVNPKAGKKKSLLIETFLSNNINGRFTYEILWWKNASQNIEEEINNYINKGFDTIVAVGGDGTMNRVGASLIGKNVIFGIVPFGSGNGLARHLKIPLKAEKAIENIINGHYTTIDGCTINNIPFFCTSGVGFDAHIGYLFATDKKRGFWRYVKIVLSELKNYKSQSYILKIENEEAKNYTAFLITFANANQYGNNTFIAPKANIQDGLMDITIIKKFKFYHVPQLIYRIFNRTIYKSSVVETFTAKKAILERKSNAHAHYDGEPVFIENRIELSIIPKALKIITPISFNEFLEK